jgi:D-aminopeptidase
MSEPFETFSPCRRSGRGATHPGAGKRSAGRLNRARPTFRSSAAVVCAVLSAVVLSMYADAASAQSASAPSSAVRARAIGLAPGIFGPGRWNAITDVAGVRVGHATVSDGDSLRTGVTAIVPHRGDLFRDRVPAALHVGNGFGKLLGVTQLRELGELETPILLTCTLCIWQVGDAVAQWVLQKPENSAVRSINPVVGETNDGGLNATRVRPGIGAAAVRAIEMADTGSVTEGSVGAGHGTIMFGWKGGIGTSSRVLPASLGGYTIGVLVQGNYGGVLQMAGVPIGPLLGRYSFQRDVDATRRPGGGNSPSLGDAGGERGDGSCMIVIATDAPMLARNLERLGARAIMGLARTGSSASNGSGDYVLAFSTAAAVRRNPELSLASAQELGNDAMSALFQAVTEATEEALYNALLTATPVTSRGGRAMPLPVDSVRTLLRARGIGAAPTRRP